MYKSLDFSINELKREIDKIEKIKTIFPECVAQDDSFLLPKKYLSEEEIVKIVSDLRFHIEFDFYENTKKEVMCIRYSSTIRKEISKNTIYPFNLMSEILAINNYDNNHTNNTNNYIINEELDYNWIVFIQKNNKTMFEVILKHFKLYNVSLNDKFKKIMMLL